MPALRKSITSAPIAALLLPAAALLSAPQAHADSSPYIGGSIGQAALKADIDYGVSNIKFDEDDTGYKLFAGYVFDFPVVDFSVEGGYVDFGNPSGRNLEVDVTGLDAFAVVGLDFGIVGIFAKAGFIAWDADVTAGADRGSEDGTDNAYGVGVRFNIASLFLRAEYEAFDIEDTDDVEMLSVGIVWRFRH